MIETYDYMLIILIKYEQRKKLLTLNLYVFMMYRNHWKCSTNYLV